MDKAEKRIIGITACSDGQPVEERERNERLFVRLKEMGVLVKRSPYLYRGSSIAAGSGRERAGALMELFLNKKVEAVFDISGGDSANEVLEHLNYGLIEKYYKPFFGYSDLTTVLNAIYARTGKKTCLFQLKNLVYDREGMQEKYFRELITENRRELFSFHYTFLQGEQMEGEVIGGNIRCFLKLSGTPYIPDFTDKILFLESLGGEPEQIVSYINLLKQLGAFSKIRGVLLGSFTQMEKEHLSPSAEELFLLHMECSLPVAKTMDIGHSKLSRALIIGERILLEKGKGKYTIP